MVRVLLFLRIGRVFSVLLDLDSSTTTSNRNRNTGSCAVVVVVITIFTVVCFIAVHPRGGHRGRRRRVEGSLRVNSRVVAVNNVMNEIIAVHRRSLIVRANTSHGGVAVRH